MVGVVIVFLLAAFLIFLLAHCGWTAYHFSNLPTDNSRQYLATHPPISDEQYLQQFDWDVDPEIALKVRAILTDALGVDYETIYPDARLISDLGAW